MEKKWEIINVITDEKNNKSYNIYIGNKLLDNIEELISFPNKTLIITDDNIPDTIITKVSSKANNCYIYKIKPGENSKTIESYVSIINTLITKEFSRSDLVIAIGGGVVGDLSGFVASTYKRGVKFINIPTSTLSMIDSSIGGKVAINFNDIKNIVGSFYMPNMVIISLDTLNSLPERQYYNGLMEALKAGLIYDKGLYEYFIKNFEKIKDYDVLKNILIESVKIKRAVVEIDPYEMGLRKILNFGHTIGHVIESENFNAIFHGEAVLMGMMCFCSESVREDLKSILYKLKEINKVDYDNINFDSNKAFMLLKNDKKCKDNFVDVIYVENPGEAEIRKTSLDELKIMLEG